MAPEPSRRRATAAQPGGPDSDSPRPLNTFEVLVGYVFAVLVAAVSGSIGAALSGDQDGIVALLTGQAGFWTALLVVVALGRHRSGSRAPAVGLDTQVRWIDVLGVGVGVFTQLVLLPLLYFPFRSTFEEDDLSAPAEDLLGTVDGSGLVAMGIGVVVIAPIVEELFFRGLLLDTMKRRWGTAAAVVGSSVFFGATHFQLLQFAGLTLAGLVFAAAVVWTGRLGTAIAVHAGFNATTFVALVVL